MSEATPGFLQQAERFVDLLRRETGFQVVVCDASGTIVAATLHKRIGQAHPGALKLLRGTADEYAVTAEDVVAEPTMREGLNCPIVVGGQRVGTFGIAGPLVVARPLARLAARILSSALEQAPAEDGDAGGSLQGPQARALSGVVRELTRAAEETKATATTTAVTLTGIATAIEDAARALRRCAASATEQLQALRRLDESVSTAPLRGDDPDRRR
jgi:putative sugar diacid recognition protein